MTDVRSKYLELMRSFLDGEMSAEVFSTTYVNEFKAEDAPLHGEQYDLLQRVFGEAESFTTDAELLVSKPQWYVDEQSLRRSVLQIWTELLL
jgi:hypothetical protein